MSETPLVKYKTNPWKDKYRECKKGNKHLLRSTTRLRIRCARKDQRIQSQKKLIQAQARALEKAEGKIHLGVKPKRHKYGVVVILMSIHFQAMLGLSYRQVQEVIRRFILMADLELSTPSATSIRNWVRKMAYHRLCGPIQVACESSILMVDESAGIGQEKILMILRLNEGNAAQAPLKADTALTLSQAKVILVKSRKSWNGEQIQEEITKAMKRIGGRVKYIISDRCSNLIKAFRLGGYTHINDCTHLMASHLECFYKNDTAFTELMGSLGKIRQKWVNSENSSLIAPNMRTKSRFLNLFEIVAWMEKVLVVWDKITADQKKELHFLHQHPALIAELIEMTRLVKEVSRELKAKGITKESERRIGEICGSPAGKRENILAFAQKMQTYLAEKRLALPNEEMIYCCSDVIESFFGKFKNRSHQGTAKGISDDMIVMSLFSGQLSKPEVRQAMEEVILQDIDDWAKENTIPSFAKAKNQFWQNLGPKAA